ncbi:MAG: hypothetical protein KQJ78_22790 [Deltaproteobacteria bacterium]|nr:hypothetical protein [Deltaproteobacteria bacterium]
MEKIEKPSAEKFEPELYCLRCEELTWDEESRRCANFDGPLCPITLRHLLAGLEITYLVV